MSIVTSETHSTISAVLESGDDRFVLFGSGIQGKTETMKEVFDDIKTKDTWKVEVFDINELSKRFSDELQKPGAQIVYQGKWCILILTPKEPKWSILVKHSIGNILSVGYANGDYDSFDEAREKQLKMKDELTGKWPGQTSITILSIGKGSFELLERVKESLKGI